MANIFDDSQPLPEGTRIMQYVIDRVIGEGSYGHVYLGHHAELTERVYAIKELKVERADKDTVKRFIRESHAMGKLRHPNVVYLHDAISPNLSGARSYIIVTDYVDGGSLADWLRRADKPLRSLSETIRVVQSICNGLAAAHREKIVHRDMKPANVLLNRDGSQIKIADWGLAHFEEHKMTQMGAILGTVSTMSPEQAKGDAATVDGRADLFAVGAILYEMTTGRTYLDFQKIASEAVMQAFLKNPGLARDEEQRERIAQKAWYRAIPERDPIDPRTYVSEMHESLRQILLKSLKRNPAERFQTTEEFIVALDDLAKEVLTGKARSSASDERIAQGARLVIRAKEQRLQRNYSKALELLNEAQSLCSGDIGLYQELTLLYNMMGRHDLVIQILEQARARNPKVYSIPRDLGFTYARMGQVDKAIAAFRQALDLNPNQSEIVNQIRRLEGR